jgi:hypothetical protein
MLQRDQERRSARQKGFDVDPEPAP